MSLFSAEDSVGGPRRDQAAGGYTPPESFVVEDARTWGEMFKAADKTLRARAWNADLFAAFRTARAYYAKTYGAKLREAYGDEWLKVVNQAFEVYAALMDAAADDDAAMRAKSHVLRFPLPAWRAQTYLSRKAVPYIADEKEFARVRARLRRAWSRHGFRWVHKLQCVTGDALFECEAPEFRENPDREAAFYVDHLNDLLSATIRASRRLHGRRRVNNIEAAFVECIGEFRADGRVPSYASRWEPPPAVDEEERRRRAALRLYRFSPTLFCFLSACADETRRRSGARGPAPRLGAGDEDSGRRAGGRARGPPGRGSRPGG